MLDQQAQTQIVAVRIACAARSRACAPADDPAEPHVAETEMPPDHPDAIHAPGASPEDYAEPRDGDEDWRTLDLPDHRATIAAAVASVKAAKEDGRWEAAGEEVARLRAEQERKAQFRAFWIRGSRWIIGRGEAAIRSASLRLAKSTIPARIAFSIRGASRDGFGDEADRA